MVPDPFIFFSPWVVISHFSPPTSETSFLPSLSADAFAPLFNWENCFWLRKWMFTNSPATSTKLLKSELCSHLTVYGFAVLFQSQSLHLDLTSHSPFAFSQTLLQCFSFYCINNFSLSTESSPSAYKHIVIALILKKKNSCHPCLMEASAPFPPCWPQNFKIWFYPLSSVLLFQFLSILILSKSGS